MRTTGTLLSALIFSAMLAPLAHATVLTFTETMTVTKTATNVNSTLGGTIINGNTLVITGTYDTAQDTTAGSVIIATLQTLTFSLNGGTAFTGTDTPFMLVEQPNSGTNGSVQIYGSQFSALTFAATTPNFGGDSISSPFSALTLTNKNVTAFSTTAGQLNISAISGNASISVAGAQPAGVTPEPSSLALLSTGLAGLGGMIRRRLLRA